MLHIIMIILKDKVHDNIEVIWNVIKKRIYLKQAYGTLATNFN